MLRLFIKILIFVFVSDYVDAQQRICGNEKFWQDNVSLEKKELTYDLIKNYLVHNFVTTRSPIYIPVVVHVLWSDPSENISEADIIEQLEILNIAFSGTNYDITKVPEEFKRFTGSSKIRFCLANVSPENLPTTGIIRICTNIKEIGLNDNLFDTKVGGSDAWDSEKYLNVWVANTGNFISGFGTYPTQTPPEKTGVVVHPKYFGKNNHPKYGLGRTLVHEIGHYLGLQHLWGDDTDCTTDDGVEDTPPQLKAYKGCASYPQSGCSTSEMFMNYMDYVDDGCMYFFTNGQIERMIASINLYRPGIMNDNSTCSNFENFNTINIFPNPSIGIFEININLDDQKSHALFNNLGQRIHPTITKNIDANTIDLSLFPSGVYYLNINNKFHKLIVAR